MTHLPFWYVSASARSTPFEFSASPTPTQNVEEGQDTPLNSDCEAPVGFGVLISDVRIPDTFSAQVLEPPPAAA